MILVIIVQCSIKVTLRGGLFCLTCVGGEGQYYRCKKKWRASLLSSIMFIMVNKSLHVIVCLLCKLWWETAMGFVGNLAWETVAFNSRACRKNWDWEDWVHVGHRAGRIPPFFSLQTRMAEAFDWLAFKVPHAKQGCTHRLTNNYHARNGPTGSSVQHISSQSQPQKKRI